MNPLDIYKLLPRTNCGACEAKTCMSFAVILCGDPSLLGRCPALEAEKAEAIGAMLRRGDWRDELASTLMEEVSGIDFDEVAPGLGCPVREGSLVVRCIGQEYTIGRGGGIAPDEGNKWIKILLLHYVRSRGRGSFSGKWVSFSELKGGFVKASTFQRECEEPLRRLMDEDTEGLSRILAMLGASAGHGFSADLAWSLDLLPRVRALILYRRGDEEFPSSLNMLFDAVTPEFIDVESLIFLCEGLVHTATRMRRA